MEVFLGQRRMHGDYIRFPPQLLQGNILSVTLHFLVFIQIIGQDTAAKAAQVTDNGTSYASRPNYAHRKILQLPALDSFQRIILDIGPLQDTFHFADAHENQHYCIIRHPIRPVGRIAHMDAEFPGSLQIHMIIAYGPCGDVTDAVPGKLRHQLPGNLGGNDIGAFTALRNGCDIIHIRRIRARGKLQPQIPGIFFKPFRFIKFP